MEAWAGADGPIADDAIVCEQGDLGCDGVYQEPWWLICTPYLARTERIWVNDVDGKLSLAPEDTSCGGAETLQAAGSARSRPDYGDVGLLHLELDANFVEQRGGSESPRLRDRV